MNNKINSNNKQIIIAIILILGIGAGILGYWQYRNKTSPIPSISPIASVSPSISTTPAFTPPPEVWETYTNSQLGFSIKYPRMVYGINDCIDAGSTERQFFTPLQIFEDIDNKMAFIVPKYYYHADRQWDSKNLTTQIGQCKKLTHSLESLKNETKKQQQEGDKNSPSFTSGLGWTKAFLGWTILIRDIKNENKLNKFIKENYGLGCFVGDKKPWKQNGVYEIEIKSVDWDKGADLGTTTCSWSSKKVLLFAPEKNKFISVNLGQECTFGTDYASESYKCYDEEMVNSFKFE